MEKKKIIAISTSILLFLLIALFFFNEEEVEKSIILNEEEFALQSLHGYEVYEEELFYLIKNNHPPLSFKIPITWSVDTHEENQGLRIYSKEEDCHLLLSFYKNEEDLLYYKEMIDLLLQEEITREDISLIEIDDFYGYQTEKTIKIPLSENIFIIEKHTSSQLSCQEEVFDLIKSISLTKK